MAFEFFKNKDSHSSEGKGLDRLTGVKISELLPDDFLELDKVAREAFKDNQELLATDLSHIREKLPSDAPPQGKGFSFKAENDGHMSGYIIAYTQPYRSADNIVPQNSEILYIADFAVANSKSIAGARVATQLITAFLQRYKLEYIDRADLIPILARTREQTSRKFLIHVLSNASKQLKMPFEFYENEPYFKGGDSMYRTIIKPKQP